MERECLRVLVNYGSEPYDEEHSIADFIMEETADISFDDPLIQQAMVKAGQLLEAGEKIEPDRFIGPEDPQMSQMVIDLLDMKYFVSEVWASRHRIHTTHESEALPEGTFKVVLRLKKKKLEMMIADNDEELKRAQETGSIAEQDELLQMKMHLKTMFDQVNNELGTIVNK